MSYHKKYVYKKLERVTTRQSLYAHTIRMYQTYPFHREHAITCGEARQGLGEAAFRVDVTNLVAVLTMPSQLRVGFTTHY